MPTLISTDFQKVVDALKVVKKWFKHYGNSRGVIGIHLEGPFICKEKKGIHMEKNIIEPTDDLLGKIVPYAELFPIMMTIAPEQFS